MKGLSCTVTSVNEQDTSIGLCRHDSLGDRGPIMIPSLLQQGPMSEYVTAKEQILCSIVERGNKTSETTVSKSYAIKITNANDA